MRGFTVTLAALLLSVGLAGAQEEADPDEAAQLRQQLTEIEERLVKVEMKAAKDPINFNGDFRVEAHSYTADIPAHFDGMMLQNLIVNTMFYYGGTGQFPMSPEDVGQFIAQNYSQYLYFTDNLTFEGLQQAMAMFPPEMQQQLIAMLLSATAVDGYDADNSLMCTSRLRLGMDAKVAENVKFTGRLSMYKTWGDSTGVQVFNGQSNTFDIDGNTTGVPNSNILRVDRADFDWTDIAGALLMRRDGPLDWFVNLNYNKSHPDPVTTPFGGLFSDPFETPEEHSGSMWYVGARYNFKNDTTMIGLEYNHGSEYWFNFTPTQDDILAAKTNTRGDVLEAYVLHRINRNFMFRFGYQDYTYDYSGSGWHLGAPKPLDEMPILGYPTYDSAQVFSLAMTASF